MHITCNLHMALNGRQAPFEDIASSILEPRFWTPDVW
jgi:hypothetical protein